MKKKLTRNPRLKSPGTPKNDCGLKTNKKEMPVALLVRLLYISLHGRQWGGWGGGSVIVKQCMVGKQTFTPNSSSRWSIYTPTSMSAWGTSSEWVSSSLIAASNAAGVDMVVVGICEAGLRFDKSENLETRKEGVPIDDMDSPWWLYMRYSSRGPKSDEPYSDPRAFPLQKVLRSIRAWNSIHYLHLQHIWDSILVDK